MGKTSENNTPEMDVVVSSRVRLARNCVDYPFTPKLTIDDAINVVQTFESAILHSDMPLAKQLICVDSTKMTPLDKACLVEKHLISREFSSKKEITGLILSKDETISLMINEEDHLRIQVIMPGLQLGRCWESCNLIDNVFEGKIEYAYSDEVGYLTSCPTNVGTGMRVSVMVHLPALAMLGYLRSLFEAVNKLGVTVRGLYGEGSEFMGNMYQLSNQVSLGQSEEEILTKINIIAHRIIQEEKLAREKLLESRIQLEDRLLRAYGVFSNARILSSSECMKLLSDVRLGVELGIINNVKIESINELVVLTQPANLQRLHGNQLTPAERDIKRAELVRKKLGGVIDV